MQKILVGLLSIIAICGILNLANIQQSQNGFLMDEMVDQWLQWKQQHERNYGHDIEHIKFANFKNNSEFIKNHNKSKSSYKLEANQFMDVTFEEFSSMFANSFETQVQNQVTLVKDNQNSQQIDWRYFGAVSPVKSIGQSSESWAFAVTGTLETLYWKSTQEITSFSEQQLIDCTEGGFENAFQYAQTNGLTSSGNYPYNKGEKHTCVQKKSQFVSKSHVSVQPQSESAMEQAIMQNTVAGMIKLSPSIQFYRSGVLDGSDCNDNQKSVALLITGYNNNEESKFYSLRNNWGTTWGEFGYIRILKNGDGKGTCGILTQAMYPTQ